MPFEASGIAYGTLQLRNRHHGRRAGLDERFTATKQGRSNLWWLR